MDIYIPTIDSFLCRLVVSKISLDYFISRTISFGASVIYVNSDITETLKTEFKSKTGSDLIFTETENDLLHHPNLNKYFVQCV